MVVSAIADDTGVRLGALICVGDITRRVEAVAKAHESRKMASLGQMAGKMAHHFNNILGGIVTSVDYALTSDEDADCRRVLERTSHALGRATHLVRGLLAFAEGDSGSHVQCDLAGLLRNLIASLEPRAARHGVKLTFEWPELAPLTVPRSQITTVLQNLTQNALDAMPDGGELSLAVVRSDAGVLVRVCDTGCGLDPAELKRIFEPFYRAEDAQSLALPSMARGLGLAVAFGIMQQMGGSILAQSERNKGSCFEISIPIAKCG